MPDRPSQNDTIGAGFLRAANVDQIRFCIFYKTFGLGYSDSDGIGMTGNDGGVPETVTSDAQTTPSIIFPCGAPTVQAVILGRYVLKYSAFPCAAKAALSVKASSM